MIFKEPFCIILVLIFVQNNVVWLSSVHTHDSKRIILNTLWDQHSSYLLLMPIISNPFLLWLLDVFYWSRFFNECIFWISVWLHSIFLYIYICFVIPHYLVDAWCFLNFIRMSDSLFMRWFEFDFCYDHYERNNRTETKWRDWNLNMLDTDNVHVVSFSFILSTYDRRRHFVLHFSWVSSLNV